MSGNDCWNIVCFSCWWKADNELADVTMSGSLFQSPELCCCDWKRSTVDGWQFEQQNSQWFDQAERSAGRLDMLATRTRTNELFECMTFKIPKVLIGQHFGSLWPWSSIFWPQNITRSSLSLTAPNWWTWWNCRLQHARYYVHKILLYHRTRTVGPKTECLWWLIAGKGIQR